MVLSSITTKLLSKKLIFVCIFAIIVLAIVGMKMVFRQNMSKGILDFQCNTHKDCPYEIFGDVDSSIPKYPAYCDNGRCREPINDREREEINLNVKGYLLNIVGPERGGHADTFDGDAIPLGFVNKIFCEGNKMDHPKCPFHSRNIPTIGDTIVVTKPSPGVTFSIGDVMEIVWEGGPNYKGGRSMSITLFRMDNPQKNSNPWNPQENMYSKETRFLADFDGINIGYTNWKIPTTLPNTGAGVTTLIPASNYYLTIGCAYGFTCGESPLIGPFTIEK